MQRDELVYSKIIEATKLIDEIDELIATQSEANQKIDQEIGDWLHYIENNDISEKESVNIVAKLKELRIIRRSLRKEYEIEKVYKDNASKMMGNNTRGLLLSAINSMVKQLDSEYKNRVLSEEKIEEVLNVAKRKVGRPRKNENNNEEEIY